MSKLSMISNVLKPRPQKTTAKPQASSIGVSPILTKLAYLDNPAVFAKLQSSADGISGTIAATRMAA